MPLARPATAITLAVIVTVAALGLAALLVWQNYQSAIAAGARKAQAAVQVVAANTEWMLEASDQTLRRIDATIGDGPIGSSEDTVEDISKAVGDLPAGFQYSVYDATGTLKFSSIPHASGVKVDDRDYFKEIASGKSLVISVRLIERLSGVPVFIIARRIVRNGKFHGLATIAIPTAKLNDFWMSIGLGATSTLALARDDGWVVARRPDVNQALNISSSPAFKMLKQGSSGSYINPASPVDGISRIVYYRRIDRWPLIAIAGIATNEALDMFWQTLKMQLAVGLPFLFLLIAFTFWISWLLRAFQMRNEQLEEALERNRFLFREIHHRVKNNLQAVSSLIRLQPLPDAIRADMVGRIAAMVAVHEHIYQSDQFERVDLPPYIEQLVSQIARGYPDIATIETRLAPLTVDRDLVLPIGMIVNEVISNAFKYAFSETSAPGRLLVQLVQEGAFATLTIKDNGPGMSGDGKKGMGSRLIAGFVDQIDARYTLANENGVTFTMTFPLRQNADSAADRAA